MSAKDTLIEELRRHALIVGEVTLTSGATAQYYVDAKRAILQPTGFAALSELIAGFARQWEATAVGGLTMGADAPACAALAGGADVKAFFVRKEAKAHGLQRKVEGPPLEPGERCLIVEDVVTSGGSTVQAIEAVRAEGYDVVGVVSVLDRLAGGADGDRARLWRRALRGLGDDRRGLPGPAGPRQLAPLCVVADWATTQMPREFTAPPDPARRAWNSPEHFPLGNATPPAGIEPASRA